MAAGSQLLPALQEIDRGLRYQPSSELRLLGAILSKRIGDFEQMRYHVAAIPVDDVLRPEGEWLLRSHQMRQRELREASKAPGSGRAEALVAVEDDIPYAIQQVQPKLASKSAPTASQRRLGYSATFVLLLLVVVGGSVLLARNSHLLTSLFSGERETALPATNTESASSPTDFVEPARQPSQEATVAAAPQVAETPTPTPTLAPNVPDNVVQGNTDTPEEIAASTPGTVIGISAAQPFDLQTYLIQLNRADLAQLEVSATFQGTILALEGFVPTFEARQALIALAQTAPGATSVTAVGLLLRLPDMYVVQEGDTLWDITYRLYGDMEMMPVLVDANRAVMPSPGELSVGMKLKVPPSK